MFRRLLPTFRSRTACILVFCLVLVILCNYIYFRLLTSDEQVSENVKLNHADDDAKATKARAKSVAQIIEDEYWAKLSFDWLNQQRNVIGTIDDVDVDTGIKPLTLVSAWNLAKSWVEPRQVYPKQRSHVRQVLQTMIKAPVVSADVDSGGTQLKIMLHFKGGQSAVFKPMRYSRDKIFEDSVYSGADRHNGEIAAFQLSTLLDLRWVPLAVGRKLDVKREIFDVAQTKLRKTFFTRGNSTCFYGVCYYCNVNDAVCSSSNGWLEGAVILWLPHTFHLKMFLHPWRRSYKSDVKAPWEISDSYCMKVKRSPVYRSGLRLLDLVDVAIFDFLIGNGDRHRYELFDGYNDSAVLLLDNGKSFGNPNRDEITILAPLYQCCVIRSSTIEKLKSYPGRSLSGWLRRLLSEDPVDPVLTEAHLTAIDRRRLKVLSVVDYCLKTAKYTRVVQN